MTPKGSGQEEANMQSVPTSAFAATGSATYAGRTTARLLLAVALVAVASAPGHAQFFPGQPIKIVVPFPAGGPTDVAARLAAQSLSSQLGQNVVVENLVGAGGRIGTKAVAEAKPDGHTL
jgi:tripartite-type tricarboxylate transporter receptor subunit TctC